MAGTIPSPTELITRLSIEQQRQAKEKTMDVEGTSTKGLLLDADDEAIAFRDLSHQRSPVETRPPPTVLTGPINTAGHGRSNSDGVRGWRRSQAGSPLERRDTLALGRLYEKMGNLSIIPRYLIYILPLAAIIAIPLVIGAVFPGTNLGVTKPPSSPNTEC